MALSEIIKVFGGRKKANMNNSVIYIINQRFWRDQKPFHSESRNLSHLPSNDIVLWFFPLVKRWNVNWISYKLQISHFSESELGIEIIQFPFSLLRPKSSKNWFESFPMARVVQISYNNRMFWIKTLPLTADSKWMGSCRGPGILWQQFSANQFHVIVLRMLCAIRMWTTIW